MRRKNEKPDYIYFTKKQSRRKKIEQMEKEIAGIRILEMRLYEKENQTAKTVYREKLLKGIQRKLRKYDLTHCIIGATEEMAELLEMEDLLFQARKLELLRHMELIFKKLKPETGQKRSSMLLVLDSSKWNIKDILTILVTAKDYYEDITLMMKEEYFDVEQLQNDMYADWGVVLHFVNEDGERKEADFGLILSEEWKEALCKNYSFSTAYQVAEREDANMKRRKLFRFSIEKAPKNGNIYSGLAYEKAGVRLPYQMAVNIAAQKPVFYEEFQISIVAIYRQEW